MDFRERGSHARGVYPTLYLAHWNSKGDTRGRRRQKYHGEGVVRNMEGRNAIRGESPNQGLTSAKDLAMELPERHHDIWS